MAAGHSAGTFLICTLGEARAGKSAVLTRIYGGMRRFEDDFEYPGCFIDDGVRRQIYVDGHACLIEFFELRDPSEPSTDELQALQRASGWFFIYPVNGQEAFKAIPTKWLPLAMKSWKQPTETVKQYQIPVRMVCATKTDLDSERTVSSEQGQAMASSIDAGYAEVSAHYGPNEACLDVFPMIVRQWRQVNRWDPLVDGTKPNDKVKSCGIS